MATLPTFGAECLLNLNSLAEVYRAQNRQAEALPLLERALAIEGARTSDTTWPLSEPGRGSEI